MFGNESLIRFLAVMLCCMLQVQSDLSEQAAKLAELKALERAVLPAWLSRTIATTRNFISKQHGHVQKTDLYSQAVEKLHPHWNKAVKALQPQWNKAVIATRPARQAAAAYVQKAKVRRLAGICQQAVVGPAGCCWCGEQQHTWLLKPALHTSVLSRHEPHLCCPACILQAGSDCQSAESALSAAASTFCSATLCLLCLACCSCCLLHQRQC